LNGSVAARYVLDEASVVRAIPGVAFGLKRPANSVAIFEYSVAHDVILHGQRLEYVLKSNGEETRQNAEPPSQLLLLLATCVGMIALLVSTLRVLLRTSCMFPALRVIAFAVLFIRSPVRLCGMFVKFSGFVVIVICHIGSVGPAPRAHQLTGIQAVPRSHGMV
jgi:hypothetical protein